MKHAIKTHQEIEEPGMQRQVSVIFKAEHVRYGTYVCIPEAMKGLIIDLARVCPFKCLLQVHTDEPSLQIISTTQLVDIY